MYSSISIEDSVDTALIFVSSSLGGSSFNETSLPVRSAEVEDASFWFCFLVSANSATNSVCLFGVVDIDFDFTTEMSPSFLITILTAA
jgi:hypothetical protein